MDSNRQKKQSISNYLLKKRKRTIKPMQSSSLTIPSKNSEEINQNYSEVSWNFKQFLGFNWKDHSFSKDIKHLSKY